MTERKSEYQVRKEKVDQLRKWGINPYVENFDKTHRVNNIIDNYDNKKDLRDSEELVATPIMQVCTAWRVTLFRAHGKLSFARIQDGTGTIQVMFHRDNCQIDLGGALLQEIGDEQTGISAYKFLEKMIDAWDFIGVRGEVFRTHKGELTIFASEFMLLTKALLPLGDKFHGIEDMETRLRKRYLDTVFHTDVRDMLYRRSKFWQSMREFLLKQSFMEVETPILETTTGWADANPFATHHDALDLDVYLRISCGELRQKRLMVAWFEKTFEIGRIFRNEGMSPEHAQDYTQMENYRAYADYRQMMALVKDMYMHIIDTVYPHKNRKFTIRGYEVDFNKEREEIDYATIIKEKTAIDIFTATEEEIESKLRELKVKYEPHNRIRLIDTLRKYCRKQLSWPAFLVNVPTFISPLAKSKVDKPELTNRFQVIIAGSEVGNGFSELNDPLDQRSRFEEQQAMRDAWDDEAQMADREYVEALEHGMPPTAWFGVSERLFCFLEDKPIREAQYFPLMKPEHNVSSWVEHSKTKDPGKEPNNLDSSLRLPTWLSGSESQTYTNLPSIQDAHALAKKYLDDTLQHCEQVAKVMQHFAKKLDQDEDVRYIAWLLHDVDWDHIGKDPDQHLGEDFEKIVGEISLPAQLIADIRSHYTEKTGVPIDLLIRKYLASVDELSGFIHAYSLMRPEWYNGMKAKSILKKLKDKKFAAGVSREHCKYCETLLGIPVAEFIPEVIEALSS